MPVKLECKGGGKDMAIGDRLELFSTVNKIGGWISRRIVLLGYSPRVLKVQPWSFSLFIFGSQGPVLVREAGSLRH